MNIPYEDLSFGRLLGKGFFGEVRHGVWRQTDVGMYHVDLQRAILTSPSISAIKVIYRKSFRSIDEWELFVKEINILR